MSLTARRGSLLVVLLAGCGSSDPPSPPDIGAVTDAAVPLDGAPAGDADLTGASFTFGIEYAVPGLGSPYGATGVRAAKTQLEIFSWDNIEQHAPSGDVHSYDWTCTDGVIADFQNAGVTRLQSYLSPSSLWASKNLLAKDIMPKQEYLDDYALWVGAMMERYDGDGQDDMPGLVAPVLSWVVGAEWSGFWGGTTEDYLELLDITRTAALATHPDIKLGLIPFLLLDVFDGNPATPEQIEERLQDPPPWFRKSTASTMQLLDRGDLYDYVDLHSLGAYTELPPMLTWMRGELEKRGLSKPIWIDDAFPISHLANGNQEYRYPVQSAAERQAIYQLLLDIADDPEANGVGALPTAWLRAEVAAGLVKKIVTAAGEGAAGIQMGNTEDWAHDSQSEGLGGRRQAVFLYGAAAFMGQVDVAHTNGYATCQTRISGALRPGGRNLELLASKIDGFASVEKLANLGTGVWAYRFHRGATTVIVAWHEDDVLQLPGESELPVNVTIPMAPASSARLTRVAVDDSPSSAWTIEAEAGNVSLELTSIPILIEPQE